MVRIDEPGPRLSEEDVEAIEKRVGSVLPDPFRRFLLEYNGGLPTPDTIDVEGVPGSPTDVQVLFGVSRPIESSNIAWNLQAFAGRIAEHALPIACDSGGSLFCLCLSGVDRGSIVYYDLANAEAAPGIYRVAQSFDVFLQQLRPFD